MASIKNNQGDRVTVNRNGTSVEGIVTDRNGLVVKGARVLVINARTKKQAIVTTNKLGEYSTPFDAQKGDKLLVHVEFTKGNPPQTVVIKGFATLTKKESDSSEIFEICEDKETLSQIDAFESQVAELIAAFNAEEKQQESEKEILV